MVTDYFERHWKELGRPALIAVGINLAFGFAALVSSGLAKVRLERTAELGPPPWAPLWEAYSSLSATSQLVLFWVAFASVLIATSLFCRNPLVIVLANLAVVLGLAVPVTVLELRWGGGVSSLLEFYLALSLTILASTAIGLTINRLIYGRRPPQPANAQ